jgi:hypothetical protein
MATSLALLVLDRRAQLLIPGGQCGRDVMGCGVEGVPPTASAEP